MALGMENNWDTEEFWYYLAIRVLLDILRASSLMLFEGAVVSIIKQHGGDYGLQKLFGTFGAVIFGPLSGLLIDFGQGHSKAYVGVIVLYFCLRTLTAIVILNLDLNFKVKVLPNVSRHSRLIFGSLFPAKREQSAQEFGHCYVQNRGFGFPLCIFNGWNHVGLP